MKLSYIKSQLEMGKNIDAIGIEINKYIPIVSKMVMIQGFMSEDNIHQNGIVDECIDIQNGIAYIDPLKKEVSIVCNIINWYTNIEIDEINLENTIYDFYMTSGIWDYIITVLDKEYKTIINLINESITEELKKYNSLEAVLNNQIEKLIEKIPTNKEFKQLTKNFVKEFNKMSWDKVPMIKQMFDVMQNNSNE